MRGFAGTAGDGVRDLANFRLPRPALFPAKEQVVILNEAPLRQSPPGQFRSAFSSIEVITKSRLAILSGAQLS